MYVDPRHHDLLPGSGNAHQLAFVRGANCPADRHLFPFGDLVLNSEVSVRKGGAVDGGELFEALGTRGQFDCKAPTVSTPLTTPFSNKQPKATSLPTQGCLRQLLRTFLDFRLYDAINGGLLFLLYHKLPFLSRGIDALPTLASP